jgi:hypothetical protein
VLPSVAQYCDVRIGATEKHHGVADAVEGQCMTKARCGTKVLYLRPVLAIETPAIAAKRRGHRARHPRTAQSSSPLL